MAHTRAESAARPGTLGSFLRERREALRQEGHRYSLRQVVGRVGIEPSYPSRVERDMGSPPLEETLVPESKSARDSTRA